MTTFEPFPLTGSTTIPINTSLVLGPWFTDGIEPIFNVTTIMSALTVIVSSCIPAFRALNWNNLMVFGEYDLFAAYRVDSSNSFSALVRWSVRSSGKLPQLGCPWFLWLRPDNQSVSTFVSITNAISPFPFIGLGRHRGEIGPYTTLNFRLTSDSLDPSIYTWYSLNWTLNGNGLR